MSFESCAHGLARTVEAEPSFSGERLRQFYDDVFELGEPLWPISELLDLATRMTDDVAAIKRLNGVAGPRSEPHPILFVNVAGVLTSHAARLVAGNSYSGPLPISAESVALIARLAEKISRQPGVRPVKIVITSPLRRSWPGGAEALRQALITAGLPAHLLHDDWQVSERPPGERWDELAVWCARHGEVVGIVIDADTYAGQHDLGRCRVDAVEGMRVRDYCDVLDGLGIEDDEIAPPTAPPTGLGAFMSPRIVEKLGNPDRAAAFTPTAPVPTKAEAKPAPAPTWRPGGGMGL